MMLSDRIWAGYSVRFDGGFSEMIRIPAVTERRDAGQLM